MAGLRHFPEEDESPMTPEHRSLLAAHAKDTKQGHFQFKSSRECYEESWFAVGHCYILPRHHSQPLTCKKGPSLATADAQVS